MAKSPRFSTLFSSLGRPSSPFEDEDPSAFDGQAPAATEKSAEDRWLEDYYRRFESITNAPSELPKPKPEPTFEPSPAPTRKKTSAEPAFDIDPETAFGIDSSKPEDAEFLKQMREFETRMANGTWAQPKATVFSEARADRPGGTKAGPSVNLGTDGSTSAPPVSQPPTSRGIFGLTPATDPQAPRRITPSDQPDEEMRFQNWYGEWAHKYGMNPNPDDPAQHYDYRAAFKKGVTPPDITAGEHWPSEGKTAGHPDLVKGGFDTKTGQRVPGTSRAKDAAELVRLGWDPEAAQRLAAQPELPDYKAQGKVGFVEYMKKLVARGDWQVDLGGAEGPSGADPATIPNMPGLSREGAKKLPVVGSLAAGAEAYGVINAAQRIRDGKATPEDHRIFDRYAAQQAELQGRGTSWGYNVANIVAEMPSFMVEMYLTGGFFKGAKTATKQVVEDAASKLFKEAAEEVVKRKSVKAATAVAATAVGAAAQEVAMPQRVVRAGLERIMPPTVPGLNAEERKAFEAATAAIDPLKGQYDPFREQYDAVSTAIKPELAELSAMQERVKAARASLNAADPASVASFNALVGEYSARLQKIDPQLRQIDDLTAKMLPLEGQMKPHAAVIEKAGKKTLEDTLKDWDDHFLPALLKAVPDQFVEVFTEHAGGAVGAMAGKAGTAVGKIPGVKQVSALKAAVMERWLKSHPGKTIADLASHFADEAGWDGVLGEMSEEWLGDLMRGAQPYLRKEGEQAPALVRMITGEATQGKPKDQSPRLEAFKDFLYEQTQAAAAFVVPGAATAGLQVGATAIDRAAGGPQQRDAAERAAVLQNLFGSTTEPSVEQLGELRQQLQTGRQSLTDPRKAAFVDARIAMVDRLIGEKQAPDYQVPPAPAAEDMPAFLQPGGDAPLPDLPVGPGGPAGPPSEELPAFLRPGTAPPGESPADGTAAPTPTDTGPTDTSVTETPAAPPPSAPATSRRTAHIPTFTRDQVAPEARTSMATFAAAVTKEAEEAIAAGDGLFLISDNGRKRTPIVEVRDGRLIDNEGKPWGTGWMMQSSAEGLERVPRKTSATSKPADRPRARWKADAPNAGESDLTRGDAGYAAQANIDRQRQRYRMRQERLDAAAQERRAPKGDPAVVAKLEQQAADLTAMIDEGWTQLDAHVEGLNLPDIRARVEKGEKVRVIRPKRNQRGTHALEDALSPEAQENLDKMFKDWTAGRQLSHIRSAMETYQDLLDTDTPEATIAAAALRDAMDAYFKKTGTARAVTEAVDNAAGLMMGGDATHYRTAEDDIFASAEEAGELVFDTLDEKTGEFDIEEFNTASGMVEFRRNPHEIFPAPKKTVNLWEGREKDGHRQGHKVLPDATGRARVEEWRATAQELGKTQDNSRKIILSLYDRTGIISQPWVDAGYSVRRFDIRSIEDGGTADDLTKFGAWMGEIEEMLSQGYQIVGLLAQPPCTSFTNSGRQHWPGRHDAENYDWLVRTYGEKAAETFVTPTDYANTLVAVVKLMVAQANPRFYLMENPVGRIKELNGLPDPTLKFNPDDYGEPWLKGTQLWGEFDPNLPLAQVGGKKSEGGEGSRTWNTSSSDVDERSLTSVGFAYAFFIANQHLAQEEWENSDHPSGEEPAPGEKYEPERAPVFNEPNIDELLGEETKEEDEEPKPKPKPEKPKKKPAAEKKPVDETTSRDDLADSILGDLGDDVEDAAQAEAEDEAGDDEGEFGTDGTQLGIKPSKGERFLTEEQYMARHFGSGGSRAALAALEQKAAKRKLSKGDQQQLVVLRERIEERTQEGRRLYALDRALAQRAAAVDVATLAGKTDAELRLLEEAALSLARIEGRATALKHAPDDALDDALRAERHRRVEDKPVVIEMSTPVPKPRGKWGFPRPQLELIEHEGRLYVPELEHTGDSGSKVGQTKTIWNHEVDAWHVVPVADYRGPIAVRSLQQYDKDLSLHVDLDDFAEVGSPEFAMSVPDALKELARRALLDTARGSAMGVKVEVGGKTYVVVGDERDAKLRYPGGETAAAAEREDDEPEPSPEDREIEGLVDDAVAEQAPRFKAIEALRASGADADRLRDLEAEYEAAWEELANAGAEEEDVFNARNQVEGAAAPASQPAESRPTGSAAVNEWYAAVRFALDPGRAIWKSFRENGATDTQLLEALGKAFGDGTTDYVTDEASGWKFELTGGLVPSLRATRGREKVSFHARELATMARVVFDIPDTTTKAGKEASTGKKPTPKTIVTLKQHPFTGRVTFNNSTTNPLYRAVVVQDGKVIGQLEDVDAGAAEAWLRKALPEAVARHNASPQATVNPQDHATLKGYLGALGYTEVTEHKDGTHTIKLTVGRKRLVLRTRKVTGGGIGLVAHNKTQGALPAFKQLQADIKQYGTGRPVAPVTADVEDSGGLDELTPAAWDQDAKDFITDLLTNTEERSYENAWAKYQTERRDLLTRDGAITKERFLQVWSDAYVATTAAVREEPVPDLNTLPTSDEKPWQMTRKAFRGDKRAYIVPKGTIFAATTADLKSGKAFEGRTVKELEAFAGYFGLHTKAGPKAKLIERLVAVAKLRDFLSGQTWQTLEKDFNKAGLQLMLKTAIGSGMTYATKPAQANFLMGWYRRIRLDGRRQLADNVHELHVHRALKKGEPVPDAVLKDYPELAKEFGRETGSAGAADPAGTDAGNAGAGAGQKPDAAGVAAPGVSQVRPDAISRAADAYFTDTVLPQARTHGFAGTDEELRALYDRLVASARTLLDDRQQEEKQYSAKALINAIIAVGGIRPWRWVSPQGAPRYKQPIEEWTHIRQGLEAHGFKGMLGPFREDGHGEDKIAQDLTQSEGEWGEFGGGFGGEEVMNALALISRGATRLRGKGDLPWALEGAGVRIFEEWWSDFDGSADFDTASLDAEAPASRDDLADQLLDELAEPAADEEPPPGVISFRSGNQRSPSDLDGYAAAGKPVGIVASALKSPSVRGQIIDYLHADLPVFIDSGAFGKTTIVDGKPVVNLNFDDVLDLYDGLIDDIGSYPTSLLWLVAPDVPPAKDTDGNWHTFPDETLALQQQYRERLGGLIDGGANVIVPVQVRRDDTGTPDPEFAGDLIQAQAAFPGSLLGLPGNRGAVPADLLEEALTALTTSPAGEAFRGVHFLGVSEFSPKFQGLVDTVRGVYPDAEITTDASRSQAMIGKGRPAHTEIETRTEDFVGKINEASRIGDRTQMLAMMRGAWEHGFHQVFSEKELAELTAADDAERDGILERIGNERLSTEFRPGIRRDVITEVEERAQTPEDKKRADAIARMKARRDAAPPAAEPVDILPTGEAQPRLPEAGAVREAETATPAFEAPFSLERETVRGPQPKAGPDLFGGDGPSKLSQDPEDAPITRDDILDIIDWIDGSPKDITFAAAANQFREDYGPKFRGKLHTAFEKAWQARRKEVRKVADVLSATPVPAPAPASKPEPPAAPPVAPPVAKPPAPTPAPVDVPEMPQSVRDLADSPVNYGKYRGNPTLVKELFEKDRRYLVDFVIAQGNATRWRQIASYYKTYRADYLAWVRGEAADAAAATADPAAAKASAESVLTPDIVEFLRDRNIQATVNNGKIWLTGKGTQGVRRDIKTADGKAVYSDERSFLGWELRASELPGLVAKLRGGGGARRRSGQPTAGYVRNRELGDLRRRADERPDTSELPSDRGDFLQDSTADILAKGGLAIGIPQFVIDEQVEDVARISYAYQQKRRAYILASEPGSGKTFVLGGAIRELRRQGAQRIVYVTLNVNLIEQVKKNLAPFEIGDVRFMTYAGLRTSEPADTDVLIFDESHNVKTMKEFGGPTARKAQEWITKAPFTVFTSATPFEDPVQMEYLDVTGLFKEEFGEFWQFAGAFGASDRQKTDHATGRVKHKVQWGRTQTSEMDAAAANEWLRKVGVYTSRRIRLDEGKLDARNVKVEAPEALARRYDLFTRAVETDNTGGTNAEMWAVNLRKRMLEAAKIQGAIDEAKSARARGRFPIIFVETKAERAINIDEEIANENRFLEALRRTPRGAPRPRRSDYDAPIQGVTDILKAYRAASGEEEIYIPPATKVIQEAFGADQVAVFTGEVTQKRAANNLEEWRAGTKPVLVATMAKGGTGLSLHDTVGDHQTTQINVNLPWTGTGVVQVSQRSARYGLQGTAETMWLFARNIDFDRALAHRVGGRMADLGATVHGEALPGSRKYEDWDFGDASFAAEEVERLRKGMPWTAENIAEAVGLPIERAQALIELTQAMGLDLSTLPGIKVTYGGQPADDAMEALRQELDPATVEKIAELRQRVDLYYEKRAPQSVISRAEAQLEELEAAAEAKLDALREGDPDNEDERGTVGIEQDFAAIHDRYFVSSPSYMRETAAEKRTNAVSALRSALTDAAWIGTNDGNRPGEVSDEMLLSAAEDAYKNQVELRRRLRQGRTTNAPMRAFLDAHAPRPDRLYQDQFAKAKGTVEFLKTGEALIRAMSSADVSTGVHELAHIARRWLFNLDIPPAQRQGISDEDITTAASWAGATVSADGKIVWNRAAEEKFARGFERYLYDGKAPTPELAELFRKFAAWLRDIYTSLMGSSIQVDISPEMRQVYDRLVMRLAPTTAAAATYAKGDFVRFETPYAGGAASRVAPTRTTTTIAGTVERILPDGRLEVRSQQGGIYKLAPSEILPPKGSVDRLAQEPEDVLPARAQRSLFDQPEKPVGPLEKFLRKAVGLPFRTKAEADEWSAGLDKAARARRRAESLTRSPEETERLKQLYPPEELSAEARDILFPQDATPVVSQPAVSRPAAKPAVDHDPNTTTTEMEVVIAKGALFDLIGPRMYEKPIVEVTTKELVQNSFDAVRNEGATTENPGRIDVTLNAPARMMTVTDNGRGMTPEILEKAFFTVAGTHKEGAPENTSGGLGLAKMAFMIGSSSVEVTTTRDGYTHVASVTSEQVREGKIQVRSTATPGKPNGTSVTTHIPTHYTDMNGERKEIYISGAMPGFLKQPLLGPAVVTFNGETLPLGVNFTGFRKETEFDFDWGSVHVYINPVKSTSMFPDVHVLSAGLYQFNWYNVFESENKLPYDLILDVRPKVRAQNIGYPFNNQRENFRGSHEGDKAAMQAYLRRMATEQTLLDAKDTFASMQPLPKIDLAQQLSDAELQDLERELALRRRRLLETQVVARKPATVRQVKFNADAVIVTYSDNTKKSTPRADYVQPSFKPKREIDFADTALDVSAMDPSVPSFHNNTNAALDDIDGFMPLVTEIGNTLVAFMREWGQRVPQYSTLEDESATGWFGGVSIDKTYRGLNMVKPLRAIWLNPGLLSGDAMESPDAAASELLHLMIHEITHVLVRSEGAQFTAELATNHARLRLRGIRVEYFETILARSLRARWGALKDAHDRVSNFDTRNRGASFKSSAATGPDAGAAPADQSRLPEVDAPLDERGRPEGRGGSVGAGAADRQTPIGDILAGDVGEPSVLAQSEDPPGYAAIARDLTPAERAGRKTSSKAAMVEAFRDLPYDADFTAVAKAGSAARGWYTRSMSALHDVFGDDTARFAGVLAALSPQVSVTQNLKDALKFWIKWQQLTPAQQRDPKRIERIAETEVGTSLGSKVPNLIAVLTSDDPATAVLSGPKVNSFARNLFGYMQEVTADTWMAIFGGSATARMFAGQRQFGGTDPGKVPGYLAYTAKVRRAARQLTAETGEVWTPAEVQETIWAWTRQLYLRSREAGQTAVEHLESGLFTDEAIASAPVFDALLTDPAFRSILGPAYGRQLGRLARNRRAPGPGSRPARSLQNQAQGEDVAAGEPALAPGEIRSARRLDRVKAERLAASLARQDIDGPDVLAQDEEDEDQPLDQNGFWARRSARRARVAAERALAADRTPGVTSRDPEVEARLQAAKGETKTSTGERLKERLAEVGKLRRHFPEISPRRSEAEAAAHEILLEQERAPRFGQTTAHNQIAEILSGLTTGQVDTFSRILILRDLMKDVEEGKYEGKELAFGHKDADALQADLDDAEAAAAATPALQAALDKRAAYVDSLTRELVKAKLLKPEVLKDPRYYHRRVIKFTERDAGAGTAMNEVRLRRRGWQRARTGGSDFNTAYHQSEFEWVAQAIADLKTRQTLTALKTLADVTQTLKVEARKKNVTRLGEKLARGRGLDPANPEFANQARIIGNEALKPYRRRMKVAIDRVVEAIVSDNKDPIDSPALNAAMDDIIDRYAVWEEENDGVPPRDRERFDTSHPLWWPLVAELAKQDSAAGEGARAIFTTKNLRDEYVQGVLGPQFIHIQSAASLMQLAPKGYVPWQPDKGNQFYRAVTVDEKVLDKVIEGTRELTEDDKKDVRAMGGQKETWIIPEWLATTLQNFKPDARATGVGGFVEGAMGLWKAHTLIGPVRVVKYNLNNTTGDMDAAAAYSPGVFMHIPGASAFLFRTMYAGSLGQPTTLTREDAARLERLVELGVTNSGMTAYEIPDVNDLPGFRRLAEEDPISFMRRLVSIPRHPIRSGGKALKAYYDPAKKATEYRESILRVAAYDYMLKQIVAGKAIYGASNPARVDVLRKNVEEARGAKATKAAQERYAALIARDLIGDYAAVSRGTDLARRRFMPFISFQEVNMKRYYWLFMNARREEGSTAAQIGRVAGVAGRGIVRTGIKTLGTLAAQAVIVNLFITAVSLWNKFVWPDEEDELREKGRQQLHLILGRRDDGTIRTLRVEGAFSALLSWIDLQNWAGDAQALYDGDLTPKDKLIEIAKAPVNKAFQSLDPFQKQLYEQVAGRRFFPDVFDSRPIRDRWEHLAGMVEPINSLYTRVTGKPVPPWDWVTRAARKRDWPDDMTAGNFVPKSLEYLTRLAVYNQDPGEAAYFDIRGRVSDFKAKRGGERNAPDPTDRANALYYYKRAAQWGDDRAMDVWYEEYRRLGGTEDEPMSDEDAQKAIEDSVKRTAPLGALTADEQVLFENELTPAEAQILSRAEDWYGNVYGDESIARKRPRRRKAS